MKIFKVMVSDGSSIASIDAIEHDGKLWLVPSWTVSHDKGWQRPVRIICLDGLDLRPMSPAVKHLADFQLHGLIPKAVLEGRVRQTEKTEYVVVEAPHIRFDIPHGIH